MNITETYSREKIVALLQSRRESSKPINTSADSNISDQEISVLLNELQIFQMELEMQNVELKASYRMLEEERAKLSGFFNQAPVGYFILDDHGTVDEANQTGAELFNVSKNNLLGKNFQTFIAAEHVEAFYNFLQTIQTNANRQFLEIKLSFNNVDFYARIEGVSITNVFTDKSQFYITVVDITESKNAQQKLMDTSERLTMTLKASSTGTWSMHVDENLIFLDEFSCQIFQIQPWEFDGKIKSFIELIHLDDQAIARQSFVNAAKNGVRIDLEFKIRTKDGTLKVLYVQGQEIQSFQARNYFAGILMDITERKRLERDAEAARRERERLILSATLIAQEKERSRISIALHDSICQILYGIRLNLQTIQRSNPGNVQFGNVNKLLDQAIQETREISYELTPSVLRDFGFIAGIQEMAHRLSVPGFNIRTKIETDLNFFDEDKQLYLFRIIQELINNCIKHAEASVAEIKIFSEEDSVKLVFSDNGKGFDYNVNKELIKGSGLRSIMNRIFLLNGNMNVESSDKGTTITIKIKQANEIDGIVG
ncbi:MAG: putative signal transduction histidine kinase [Pedobacter sp.]|nr:putative signal transduction histidine kinase [Pedobacter sp.]